MTYEWLIAVIVLCGTAYRMHVNHLAAVSDEAVDDKIKDLVMAWEHLGDRVMALEAGKESTLKIVEETKKMLSQQQLASSLARVR